MASAYEKRPGRFWARWKDRDEIWRSTPTRARTKGEAKRIAAELEQRAWRQRMGLEQVGGADGGGTVRELMTWWMKTFSEGTTSHPKNASTIKRHLLEGAIAEVHLANLSKGRVETFLDEKTKERLSAQTVNHIRGFLSRGFSAATDRDRWYGKNPVTGTKKRRGSKRLADFLRFEEVGPVIAQIPPQQHFHLFVTSLYTGLRRASCARSASRMSTGHSRRSGSGARACGTRPRAATRSPSPSTPTSNPFSARRSRGRPPISSFPHPGEGCCGMTLSSPRSSATRWRV